MPAWDLILWLYAIYISITKKFVLLHGDFWILLSMMFQAFIGWGLFATAIYRVYVIKTGIRDFAEEFASYGLPWPYVMVVLVCLMEFGIAAIFTAGIVLTELIFLTSLALAALMVLAVLARIKGKESWQKMIPATMFGLVSLGCIVIDQSATTSESVLGSLTSAHGRDQLTMLVLLGDLVTIAVTVYRYGVFMKEKEEHNKALNEPLTRTSLHRRHSSTLLEGVV